MLGYLIPTSLVLLVVLWGIAWLVSPGSPRAVVGEDANSVPGSISEKTFVEINGTPQGMFIIGRARENPVLLVVHGGMPEYFLAERYPTGLEDLFTVVWWEQRGAGISYRADLPKASITPEQLMADTVAVTNYLRERFNKQRIYLMAHSGGSFFGIQVAARHPELYHAYVGVAQYAHQIQSEILAYQYMLAEYEKLGDARLVEALKSAPVSLSDGTPAKYLALRDRAMHRLGIGTMHTMHSIVSGLFLPSLLFRGYTLSEKLRFWRAKAHSGVSVLWERSLYVDMRAAVPQLEIPVYFLEGVYDYTCNYSLAQTYFRALKAPIKGYYSFTHSAHSPHFEEPAKTRLIMERDVLRATHTLADLR